MQDVLYSPFKCSSSISQSQQFSATKISKIQDSTNEISLNIHMKIN